MKSLTLIVELESTWGSNWVTVLADSPAPLVSRCDEIARYHTCFSTREMFQSGRTYMNDGWHSAYDQFRPATIDEHTIIGYQEMLRRPEGVEQTTSFP